MSLSGDLKRLEAAQHAEVLHLHRTYLRTKRELTREFRKKKQEIRRAVSPGRLIRKHPGATLGIAAALGFFLAPSGGRRARVDVSRETGKRGPGVLLRRIMGMLKRVPRNMREAQASKASDGAEPAEKNSGPAMLEAAIISVLGAMKVDHLMGGWVRSFAEKMKTRMARHHEGNGRHPEGEGAAGAVPGSDRFDFDQK